MGNNNFVDTVNLSLEKYDEMKEEISNYKNDKHLIDKWMKIENNYYDEVGNEIKYLLLSNYSTKSSKVIINQDELKRYLECDELKIEVV